jgi:hypothetical protein
MARRRFHGFAFLFVCALPGFACSQGIGGRCVQNSDCSSGICSMVGQSVSGGRCIGLPTGVPMTDGSSTEVPGSPADARSDAPADATNGDAPADGRATDGRPDDLRPITDAQPGADAGASSAVDATADR